MEVMIKHESTVVDPMELTVAGGMRTVSTNRAIIDVPASDRSFHGYSDTDVLDNGNGRPSKKPKVEDQIVKYELPKGFLDPIRPDNRSMVFSPKSIVEHGNSDNNPKTVVPSMCKQFWKAGDYEGPVNNNESISHAGGMDHLRVHPRFLHSNATSHKWALGAFAELLDNSLDEVRTGATYVNVDVLNDEKNARNKMLLVEDNGGGMTPDKMRGCMSLGYSVKSKLANTIGQYGNGFKTSTMRLGADVLVFSRCPGQGARSSTQSIGMLSYTFLMETGKEDIVVPMIDFEKRGEDWGMMVRSSEADWKRNMETIVRWSPYSSEESLLKQFDFLKDQGTRIIIYNLWEDEEGQLELDFDADLDDIQIRGVNRDPKKIEMAKGHPNSRHFLTYRHSLRSYAAILYLSIPNGFRIILRGKDVVHHKIVDDMMLTQKVSYKPTQPITADGMPRNDQNMTANVTIGFVKDAKDHIDVQGFNVYHKNRLIKPFWRVWNAAGSDGRGVIGVLQADFVEPAHDKQGFERTTVLSRLENRLIAMQKKYWSTNCQEIGYAKRCKSVSDTKSRHLIKDKSDQYIVPIGIETNDARMEVKPIRIHEALIPLESAQNGEMPEEAYTSTPRKNQSPTSLKESKGTFRSLPSETTTNGDGDESGSYNGDMISTLKKEILELRQRLGSSESVVINDLLLDLRSEREKNAALQDQLLMAQATIEKLDNEQTKLIDYFSDERQRRDAMEATLKKGWQDALNTAEELRRQMNLLENKPLVKANF